jgi:heptosyltransferase-2
MELVETANTQRGSNAGADGKQLPARRAVHICVVSHVICGQFSPREPRIPDSPLTSSLIVQTSYLGDVVLTTPLIAELALRGPVAVLATPRGAELLANSPHIAQLLVYDKRDAQRGLAGVLSAARSIGPGSPDAIAYCAQGSVRTALVTLIAGYRERVGFATSAGRWLYTRRIPYLRDRHHAERLLRLALGPEAAITALQLRPQLFPGSAEKEAVRIVLASAGHDAEPLIALAPGSVWATKRWPYYRDLARLLADRRRIVVIGSAADANLARDIVDATGGSAIDATGKLSLLASAELLSRCDLLVTNDSAPEHLASAMGTPTVAIFGPTVPEFGFGPLAPRARVVGHESMPCRPCHPHGPPACPLGHWRCMRELDTNRVRDAADALLRTAAA